MGATLTIQTMNSPMRDFFRPMRQEEVSFFKPDALPSSLEGKEEDEWEDAEAFEDIAGEYENDDEWDEDQEGSW